MINTNTVSDATLPWCKRGLVTVLANPLPSASPLAAEAYRLWVAAGRPAVGTILDGDIKITAIEIVQRPAGEWLDRVERDKRSMV